MIRLSKVHYKKIIFLKDTETKFQPSKLKFLPDNSFNNRARESIRKIYEQIAYVVLGMQLIFPLKN